MEYELRERIVLKGRHEFEPDSCRPIRGFAVRWFSQPRVFTRGYNMPSHRDYYRLKAVLQTLRVKNVTLGVKGHYENSVFIRVHPWF